MSDNSSEHPMGMTREAFMRKVRESVGSRDAMPKPPEVDPQIVRLADENDDVVAMFAERAEAVGMKIHRVKRSELPGKIQSILTDAGAKRAGMGIGSSDLCALVEEGVANAGAELLDWKQADLREQFDLDAGITDVHAALAETGTLVCSTDTAHSRGLSLIPTIHLAVVQPADILPDMIDYWQRYDGIPNTELPASQSFITGPSKTADIEGELIVGVHGPGEVHILLLEG